MDKATSFDAINKNQVDQTTNTENNSHSNEDNSSIVENESHLHIENTENSDQIAENFDTILPETSQNILEENISAENSSEIEATQALDDVVNDIETDEENAVL